MKTFQICWKLYLLHLFQHIVKIFIIELKNELQNISFFKILISKDPCNGWYPPVTKRLLTNQHDQFCPCLPFSLIQEAEFLSGRKEGLEDSGSSKMGTWNNLQTPRNSEENGTENIFGRAELIRKSKGEFPSDRNQKGVEMCWKTGPSWHGQFNPSCSSHLRSFPYLTPGRETVWYRLGSGN